MALLNDLYVFVKSESIDYDVDSVSHPVETGVELTDTVRRKPVQVSLSGTIVGVGQMKAADVLDRLNKLKDDGSLITYKGSAVVSNLQIQKLKSSYSYKSWGAIGFSMDLKEVRIAKSPYNAPSTPGASDASNTAAPIEVGSTVVFKGGDVYVSSDAEKPAAHRGRSTCTVYLINTRSWAKHIYSLISTDGGLVWGWVDAENVETIDGNPVSATVNAGVQQVSTVSGEAVYHTVKSGDTVWELANKKYKSLGKTCQWVIDNNPDAFSRKGDPTTLQVGAKLLMGYQP